MPRRHKTSVAKHKSRAAPSAQRLATVQRHTAYIAFFVCHIYSYCTDIVDIRRGTIQGAVVIAPRCDARHSSTRYHSNGRYGGAVYALPHSVKVGQTLVQGAAQGGIIGRERRDKRILNGLFARICSTGLFQRLLLVVYQALLAYDKVYSGCRKERHKNAYDNHSATIRPQRLLTKKTQTCRQPDAAHQSPIALGHNKAQARSVGGQLYLIAVMQRHRLGDTLAVEQCVVGMRQRRQMPGLAVHSLGYGCMATADRGAVLAIVHLTPGIASHFDIVDYDALSLAGTMTDRGCLVFQNVIAPTAGIEYGFHPGA